MNRFLAEFESDDILSHLNCLELLTAIAVTSHGYQYLQEKGVLERFNNIIDDTNPLAGLLLPGLFTVTKYSASYVSFEALIMSFYISSVTDVLCMIND